jgi:hypothetical protein
MMEPFISTIVCTADPEIQHKRAIEKAAMAEYYEKHGGGEHH